MQFTKALQHTIGWKALNTILTFLINLLLVRILGADGSGDFYYAITILSFFTLAISWSMEAGIIYYAANNSNNIPSITLFIIPWLLVQAAASWFLLDLIPIHIDKHLSFLYVLSNLVITYFSALYYAKKWFVSNNIIVCIVNLIVLAGLGWVNFKYNNEQWNLIKTNEGIGRNPLVQNKATYLPRNWNASYQGSFIYFIGFTIQAFVLTIVFFIKSKFKLNAPLYRPVLIKNIFLYSSLAFISNLLFFLVTRVDYYFVQKYCSEISLSNYVQVSKMGQLLILFPAVIAGVIFPFSAGLDDKNFLDKLQKLCRISGLLFMPVALLIVVSGYWIFPWLFGNGFTMMYPALLLYLPGFYCLSLLTMLAAHIAGMGMLIKNLLASGITLILVIAGDLIFIPIGGIYAAAAVSTIGYFICLLYLLLTVVKKWGSKPAAFIVCDRTDLELVLKRFFPGYYRRNPVS